MRRLLPRIGLAAAMLVAAVAVAGLPLLRAAGDFLVVADTPRPADAIVVVSGSIPDRILEAVDLYHAGLAPRLVLTREQPPPGVETLRARGGDLDDHDELNRRNAVRMGVPPSAIALVEPPVSSTFSEAEAVAEYLIGQRISTVLLVTSRAHSRRAAMTFRHACAGRIEYRMQPSRYDPFPADAWWRHRPYLRRVVIEYLKMLNFVLFDRWKRPLLPPSEGEPAGESRKR